DDFRNAMADANNKDLQQFNLWYAQNGTPEVNIEEKYDSANNKFEISVVKVQPASYQNSEPWMPMHIPMKIALYQSDRESCVLDLSGNTTLVLEITQKQQTFVFDNIEHQPIASLFQGFSAPVIVNRDQSIDELVFLMKHDLDSFNRWDAAQKIQSLVILEKYDSLMKQTDYQCPDYLPDSIRHVLLDINSDPALIAKAITLPSLKSLMLQRQEVDIHALYEAKRWLIRHIVDRLHVELLSIYNQNYISEEYKIEAEQIARRSLKTRCLAYLMKSEKTEIMKMCLDEYRAASNFTEKISAFSFLIHHQYDTYEDLLAEFYEQWKGKSLVTDRWLAIQASSPAQNTLERVKNLMDHEAFSLTNPNAVRGLIAAFCGANITQFHAKDGKGYEFLADQVIVLDRINPQIASRLASLFNDWKSFDKDSQKMIRQQLERISGEKDLSPNVYEIVEKSLNSG
ncbi:MAG: DUF3458 domain-containing protein, partial [Proteobacteria bacterium]|nr:DUF3458 domain-containing protein [Pseudomonadota bacterium]